MNYILIDSQRLSSIQNCPQKFEYQYEKNLRSIEVKPYFETGHIYHKMLKTYYSVLKYRDRWNLTEFNYDKLVEITIKIGEYFAIRGNAEIETIEQITNNWRDYTEYYRNDPILKYDIVAVEVYFAKQLDNPFEFNGEEYQVVIEGRIDLIYNEDGRIINIDHKHESAKRPFSAIRNQFLIYPLATGARTLLVNVIGTQKTKKPNEKFYRIPFSYTDSMIEEFKSDVIYYAKQYLTYKYTGYWPRNRNACDTYGICDFERICYAPPDLRGIRLEREYNYFKWDVFEG